MLKTVELRYVILYVFDWFLSIESADSFVVILSDWGINVEHSIPLGFQAEKAQSVKRCVAVEVKFSFYLVLIGQCIVTGIEGKIFDPLVVETVFRLWQYIAKKGIQFWVDYFFSDLGLETIEPAQQTEAELFGHSHLKKDSLLFLIILANHVPQYFMAISTSKRALTHLIAPADASSKGFKQVGCVSLRNFRIEEATKG